jgi:hypothetical protein
MPSLRHSCATTTATIRSKSPVPFSNGWPREMSLKADRQPLRLERASASVLRAEKFQRFVDDPDVVAFFAAYERDRIEAMVRALPLDHDGRQAAAMQISAMREFKAFIASAITAGERSLDILKKDN